MGKKLYFLLLGVIYYFLFLYIYPNRSKSKIFNTNWLILSCKNQSSLLKSLLSGNSAAQYFVRGEGGREEKIILRLLSRLLFKGQYHKILWIKIVKHTHRLNKGTASWTFPIGIPPILFPSFLLSFPPSTLPFFLSSFLPSFLLFFPPSSIPLSSFPPSFLPSPLLPSTLPSFLPFFLPSFLPFSLPPFTLGVRVYICVDFVSTLYISSRLTLSLRQACTA